MFKQKEGGRVTLERDTCALIVGVNENQQLQQSKDEKDKSYSISLSKQPLHWQQYPLPEPQQTIVFSSAYWLQKTNRYLWSWQEEIYSHSEVQRCAGLSLLTGWLCFFWLFNCRAVWSSSLLLCWWRRCLSAECVASPGTLSDHFHTESFG